MFEFQVDGPLSSRENDLLDGLATRDLIDLGDVLLECLEDAQETISVRYTHLTNESVQEGLTLRVTVGMPFEGVDFAERVELLGAWEAD